MTHVLNRTLLGAAALSLAAGVLPAASAIATPSGFAADPSALSGHGELAVVSAHHLHLIGAPAGSKLVPLPGQVSQPAWSFDHSTLAVAVAHAGKSSIWTVSANGTTTTRLTVPNAGLGRFSWAPNADILALQTAKGADQVAETLTAGGTLTPIATADAVSGLSWSPDGQHLAVAIDAFHSGWRSQLEVVPAAGGVANVIAHETNNVYDVAGWWPDGSGVLAWQDPQGSASLAADGVRLSDITVATGHRLRLPGVMLEYSQWIAGRLPENEIAYVVGADRELTSNHKHIEICGLLACHAVSQASKVVSLDPTWATPGGHLAIVRDQALAPAGGVGIGYVNAVQNSGTVLVRRPSGFASAGLGDGATAPEWAKGGGLLAVKHDALWLRAGGRTTRVAGPLTVPTNFYGFVPWSDSFAWTKSVSG